MSLIAIDAPNSPQAELLKNLVDGNRLLAGALGELSKRLPENDYSVQGREADLVAQRNIAIAARLGAEAKVRELEEMVSVLQYEKQTREAELLEQVKNANAQAERVSKLLENMKADRLQAMQERNRATERANDAEAAARDQRLGQAAVVAGFVHERQKIVAWAARWKRMAHALRQCRATAERMNDKAMGAIHERDLLKAELGRALRMIEKEKTPSAPYFCGQKTQMKDY